MAAVVLTFGACKLPSTTTTTTLAPDPTFTLPTSINCSQPDSTAALNSFLNGLPANATAVFPHGGCIHIRGTLWLHDKSALTIQGNGTTIFQTVPTAYLTNAPIIYLTQDSNVTIENLVAIGSYNGTNGGEYYEGGAGYELQSDTNVTLKGDTIDEVQGDCVELYPPNGGNNINADILVTNSTFKWCGYHGLTLQSVDGATFSHDLFSNMAVDAMDFEYDASSILPDGEPDYAVEDDVTISHDTWDDFGGYWFASIQDGVAEHNVLLAGNTIDATATPISVSGTDPADTTAPYEFTNLSILNNTWNGSDPIASSPYGIGLNYVEGFTMSGNNFPFADPDGPSLYVIQTNGVGPLVITNNSFHGAVGVLSSESNYTGLAKCGNAYGTDGGSNDGGC